MEEETRNRRVGKLALLCLLGMILLFAGGNKAYAAKTTKAPFCAEKVTMYFYAYKSQFGEGSYLHNSEIFIGNLKSNAVISDLKTNNSKVTIYAGRESVYLSVKGKNVNGRTIYSKLKDGDKAKVTFTVKQNGKKYKLQTTVKFKDLPNPVKSLRVGGKSISKYSLVSGAYKFTMSKPKTAKVSVKVGLKPGYKLTALYAVYFKEGAQKGSQIKFSNGGLVPLKKDGVPLSRIAVHCDTSADKQGIASTSYMKKFGPSFAYDVVFK